MAKRKKLKAKDVALPVALIVVLTLSSAALIAELYYNGSITIPGIGTVVLTGSGNSTQSGETIVPAGTISFAMQLIANYADNTNQTLQSSGTFPTLDVIQVHNKTVNQVIARALVAFASSNVLPAGSTASFVINYTVFNLKSYLTLWRIYHVTENMVNGTYAFVLLPEFPVTGKQVYSDICSTMANGTLACSGTQNHSSVTRRVEWSIFASLNVTTPLSLIPQSFSGATISSADFDATGSSTTCVNCNGAASVKATFSNDGKSADVGSSPGSPSGPTPPERVSLLGNTNPTVPGGSTTNFGSVSPSGGQVGGNGAARAGTSAGGGGTINGGQTGGGTGLRGAGEVGGGGPRGVNPGEKAVNLMPVSYVSFTVGGSVILASPLFIFLIIVGFGGVLGLTMFFVLRLHTRRR